MNEKKQTNVSKRSKTQGESSTEVRTEITRLYQSTHNGASLITALKANNYSLVKSTRNIIFVIDRKGGVHNLFKRIAAPVKRSKANLPIFKLQSCHRKKVESVRRV
jgi:hypothetical protein